MSFIRELERVILTFNWHNPSWDLFIFLFWVVATVIYAFGAGRGRILSILVSIYMAKLLVVEAPFLGEAVVQKLPATAMSLQQLATFAILFILFFIFLSRYAFRSSVDGRQLSGLPFSLVFAALQIGLLINIVLTLLPSGIKDNFAPLIQFVFLQNGANFAWLIAPTLFLVILGKYVGEKDV